jgi:hypothetical protein
VVAAKAATIIFTFAVLHRFIMSIRLLAQDLNDLRPLYCLFADAENCCGVLLIETEPSLVDRFDQRRHSTIRAMKICDITRH